jgi:hypothetical protein
MSREWIPDGEQDFTNLCKIWKSGLEQEVNLPAIGWSSADSAAVLTSIDTFLTASAAYEADHSISKRMAKNDAKAAAVSAIRESVSTSVRLNVIGQRCDALYRKTG